MPSPTPTPPALEASEITVSSPSPISASPPYYRKWSNNLFFSESIPDDLDKDSERAWKQVAASINGASDISESCSEQGELDFETFSRDLHAAEVIGALDEVGDGGSHEIEAIEWEDASDAEDAHLEVLYRDLEATEVPKNEHNRALDPMDLDEVHEDELFDFVLMAEMFSNEVLLDLGVCDLILDEVLEFPYFWG
jgi:hypothetical protein